MNLDIHATNQPFWQSVIQKMSTTFIATSRRLLALLPFKDRLWQLAERTNASDSLEKRVIEKLEKTCPSSLERGVQIDFGEDLPLQYLEPYFRTQHLLNGNYMVTTRAKAGIKRS